MNLRQKNKEATQLFRQKRYDEALNIVRELTALNYAPAFVLKGFIYEYKSEVDYRAALASYIQAATLVRDQNLDIHLARINMKLGDWDKAKTYTDSALANRAFPDAWFLAGDFYSKTIENKTFQSAAHDDLKVAAKYYLRAAFYGRLNALIRYKNLQIQLRHAFRALFATISLVIFGPVVRLLLGARAYYRY